MQSFLKERVSTFELLNPLVTLGSFVRTPDSAGTGQVWSWFVAVG